MRIDMIRDLKDCNQFRQTIQSKPPRVVHGVGLMLVASWRPRLFGRRGHEPTWLSAQGGRIRPVTTPNKVFIARTEHLGTKVAEVNYRQGQT